MQSAQNPLPPSSESNGDQVGADQEFTELSESFDRNPAFEQQQGLATYYANSLAGHRMANGKRYDPRLPTMAHRTLEFGTVVRVVRLSNGASVVVQVTDRGPFGDERRIADLSREAARRLGMLKAGVVEIRLEVLGRSREQKRRTVRRK